MSFRIGFGNGGRDRQWYLPGIDFSALPHPPANGVAPAADAISQTYTDPLAGALFAGKATLAAAPVLGQAGLVFDVVGFWNSVKNAVFISDASARVEFRGFVQADVQLGDGGDSAVLLQGAKRGNVITGDGNDTIRIDTLDNGGGWAADFRVVTGDGNDSVRVGALDRAGAIAAGDTTYARMAGTAGILDTSGAGQRTHVDLGDGNDVFLARNQTRDFVNGGAGDDRITAGPGNDVSTGGTGHDTFTFQAGDGNDVITDFVAIASNFDRVVIDFEDQAGLPVATLANPPPLPAGRSTFYGPLPDDYGAPGLSWTNVYSLPAPTPTPTPGQDWGTIYFAQGFASLISGQHFDLESLELKFGPFQLLGRRDGQTVLNTTVTFGTTFGDEARNLDELLFLPAAQGSSPGALIDNLTLRLLAPVQRDTDKLRFIDMTEAEAQAMLASAVQDGADTVLDYGDGSIRLTGVQKTDLSMADLILL
jgi:hypothetical protein